MGIHEYEAFKPHPLRYLVEPLMEEASYLERSMFGCRACYLFGRIVLVLAFPGEDPWNGILIPTEREHHASLCSEFPSLSSHPVLGKWLYLPEDHDDFERLARSVIARILQGDPRFGVISMPKKKTSKTRKRRSSVRRKRGKY